jgi:general stress protein YciG
VDTINVTEGESMADSNNPGQFGNRKDTTQQASAGGQAQGASNNPANFANDRKKASEAGKEGGKHSHGGGGNNA